MKSVVATTLLAGLAGLAAPVGAQRRPPDSTDTVVVVGERPSPERARREAAAFVRAMGVANGVRPAARWREPVCPRALGLRPDHAGLVERRMRAVAAEAGVPVASEPCRSNIAVSFTTNAAGVARAIASRSPRVFEDTPLPTRSALLTGSAPIRWWYRAAVEDRHGGELNMAPLPWAMGNAEGGGSPIPDNGVSGTLVHNNSSLVSTQVARVLRTATVLVDVERMGGATLDSVAAYAALVAFAEVQPDDPPPVGSLLELFRGGAARAPTPRDMDFLSALYRLPLDRTARAHRGRLKNALVAAELDTALRQD